MEYKDSTYEVVDRVARITANRPRYRNAQSTPMLIEMDHAFERARCEPIPAGRCLWPPGQTCTVLFGAPHTRTPSRQG